jgi:hypothetical protein
VGNSEFVVKAPLYSLARLIGYDGGMRIRFTIRSLLFVMLLVAICAGWLVDHMRIMRQVRDAADDLAEAQGEINRLNGNSQYENVLRRSLPQEIPATAIDSMPSLKLSPKYSIPKMSGGITDHTEKNSQN